MRVTNPVHGRKSIQGIGVTCDYTAETLAGFCAVHEELDGAAQEVNWLMLFKSSNVKYVEAPQVVDSR
jgi:hypothetical protein